MSWNCHSLCSSYESDFMVPWKCIKKSIKLCKLLAQPLKAGPSLVVEFVHLGLSLCPLCCSPFHILLLCSCVLDCIQARLGFSAFFYKPPSPLLLAFQLSVSFRGLGLSCASCSQASALWQGQAACEITPLSCSHYTRDTLYPLLTLPLNVNGSLKKEHFWG